MSLDSIHLENKVSFEFGVNSKPRYRLNTNYDNFVWLVQGGILDVVTSGQVAWDGLQQRIAEPFKSLGNKCLVFGNGDDDAEV